MSDQVFREITEDESLQDLLWRRGDCRARFSHQSNACGKDGERIGIEKGIEKGIAAFIQDYVEDGREAEAIIEKLVLRFDLQRMKRASIMKSTAIVNSASGSESQYELICWRKRTII